MGNAKFWNRSSLEVFCTVFIQDAPFYTYFNIQNQAFKLLDFFHVNISGAIFSSQCMKFYVQYFIHIHHNFAEFLLVFVSIKLANSLILEASNSIIVWLVTCISLFGAICLFSATLSLFSILDYNINFLNLHFNILNQVLVVHHIVYYN